jgi:hypothetical protein
MLRVPRMQMSRRAATLAATARCREPAGTGPCAARVRGDESPTAPRPWQATRSASARHEPCCRGPRRTAQPACTVWLSTPWPQVMEGCVRWSPGAPNRTALGSTFRRTSGRCELFRAPPTYDGLRGLWALTGARTSATLFGSDGPELAALGRKRSRCADVEATGAALASFAVPVRMPPRLRRCAGRAGQYLAHRPERSRAARGTRLEAPMCSTGEPSSNGLAGGREPSSTAAHVIRSSILSRVSRAHRAKPRPCCATGAGRRRGPEGERPARRQRDAYCLRLRPGARRRLNRSLVPSLLTHPRCRLPTQQERLDLRGLLVERAWLCLSCPSSSEDFAVELFESDSPLNERGCSWGIRDHIC